MSLLANLFGGGPPAHLSTGPETPAPAQAQAQAQAPAPQASAGQPSAAPAPSGAPEPAAAPEGVAALMALFQQEEGAQPDEVPELNLTPEILGNATKGVNFMRGVTEEMLTQVGQGDTQALMAVIQQAVRNGYESAMMDSTALAGKYAGLRSDHAAKAATKGIRSQVIESQVDVENLSPAAQSMFRQIASKVAERNPTASAQEVKAQSTALLQQLASEFNFSGKQQQAQQPVEDDWSQVFGN